jgi:hypothetical protein
LTGESTLNQRIDESGKIHGDGKALQAKLKHEKRLNKIKSIYKQIAKIKGKATSNTARIRRKR